MSRPTYPDAMYHARAAWWEDGVPELVGGLGMLLLGLVGRVAWTPGAPEAWKSVWMGVLFLTVFFSRFVIRWIKASVTWKRTGYSKPLRKPHAAAWMAIVLAFMGFLILFLSSWPLVQAMGVVLFLAGVVGSVSWYTRRIRFAVFGVIAALYALLRAFSGLSVELLVHEILILLGVGYTLSGVVQFRRVLSLPVEEDHA